MDAIFSFQLPLMLFLQGLRTPMMTKLVELVTSLGEQAIVIVVLVTIYWCIDKKKGYLIASSVLFSTVTMQILKAIFRVPRPFMKYPDQVVGERQHTATGYSFPSGHSTTASSFYGALYKGFQQKWIKAIALILVIAIPLSRLYLGVHWPMDVAVGTLIGIFFSFIMASTIMKIYESDKLFNRVAIIVSVLMLPMAAVLGIALDWTDIDYRAFHNLMQNGALAGGMFLGTYFERKNVSFMISGSIKKRARNLALGILMAAPIVAILMVIPFMHYFLEAIAYAFLGFWVSFLYPMIAVKLGWMERESK